MCRVKLGGSSDVVRQLLARSGFNYIRGIIRMFLYGILIVQGNCLVFR